MSHFVAVKGAAYEAYYELRENVSHNLIRNADSMGRAMMDEMLEIVREAVEEAQEQKRSTNRWAHFICGQTETTLLAQVSRMSNVETMYKKLGAVMQEDTPFAQRLKKGMCSAEVTFCYEIFSDDVLSQLKPARSRFRMWAC